LIQTEHELYLWEGAEIYPSNRDRFLKAIREYIPLLQTHESAPSKVVEVFQGKEPEEFWDCFQVSEIPEQKYGQNSIWNKWYMPIEDSLRSARSNRSRLQYAERDMLEEKPGLFTFPNYLECQKVFFYEDLEDEDFYVLVIKEEERAYVWRGLGFNEDDDAEISTDEFIKSTVQHFFDIVNVEDIEVIFESPGEESDHFTSYFN